MTTPAPSAEGIRVSIEINISAADLVRMPPNIVTALMGGLAQIMTARQFGSALAAQRAEGQG